MAQMNPGNLVYSDGVRWSIAQWMGPGVVGYLVVHGLVTGQLLAFLMAAALGFYVTYSWHSRYELYQNAFVIRYLWPRQMVVRIEDVVDVHQGRIFPAGDGLLVSRYGKGPLFVRPRDPVQLSKTLIELRVRPREQRPAAEADPGERPRRRPTRRRRRPR